MGYLTAYRLKIECPDGLDHQDIIIAELRQSNENAAYALNEKGDSLHVSKWYDASNDINNLSKQYPSHTFTLYGEGEERDDYWYGVYCNGEQTFYRGRVTIQYEKVHSPY